MKKSFLWVGIILLVLFSSCNPNVNPNISISFISPKGEGYVSPNQPIIIEIEPIKNVEQIAVYVSGENVTKKLDTELKENRVYSIFPDKLEDGEYTVEVRVSIAGKEFEKNIDVFLNSEIPVWDIYVYPTFVRAGKSIHMEIITSSILEKVTATFDDGTTYPLVYDKKREVWSNEIMISQFLSEGSHFIKFTGIDFKGERIEERRVINVVNTYPIIYSPLNGLKTVSKEIEILGFYDPDKEVDIYIDGEFFKRTKTDGNGDFYEKLTLPPGTHFIHTQDPNSQFNVESALQNIKITIYSKGVVVLVYHNISEKGGNLYTITPEEFEKEIKYIKNQGYTCISGEDFRNFLKGKADISDKSVLITFDDGLRGVYNYAYPILKKYGFKAVFFVIAGRIGSKSGFISWEEAKEMVESGIFEIDSHTYLSHKRIEKDGKLISSIFSNGTDETEREFKQRVLKDFMDSIRVIKENLGYEPLMFAYPYGEYSKETIDLLREAGFQFAFTVYKGVAIKTTYPFEIPRYSIHRGTDIEKILP
ncbi:MAG: hypothetical protein DRI28_02980 [Caldiserica bacterium]|nr:MAG: hypothetical protein DRI28_02980 [Caldisericota bacterium]